ncbi:Flagellum attachment zone protein 3 [Trypanosoma cruzi]|uniref:Flagellum attachment zone protein 3 n=1 Tax=Trypanosoma cruzi TaxID=5693 RepID=A0A7J6Y3Y0_TRYCR|nr:Flagellum attachment zone protein 3 [Trypanosoma cruzi]
MSASLVTIANTLSSECTYYAGDPELLKSERYAERISKMLQSEKADLLAARVAIHAQLRDAFKDDSVQKLLKPYLREDENFQTLIEDAKSRAKFFSRKQQELQAAVMASEEQVALREAHRELAAWERENAVLLRHQMFMSYKPAMSLLLESAATVALYRQYAALEDGGDTSESSSGEVPEQLVKMGGVPLFTTQAPSKQFEVDEHTKMFSQQVLQNKRVEYEEKRALVVKQRKRLEDCPSLQRLHDFINTRNDIFRKYGIDLLVSLRVRRDKALAEPFEGGEDATVSGLPHTNDIMKSRRVAQYSLAKIVEQCHQNYLSILITEDLDALLRSTGLENREALQGLKPLKDMETFRYWLLASITADTPQIGPNKLVGKNPTPVDEYKKLWQPQKSSYVPSLNTSHRQQFKIMAERRGFPHIIILSPVTYTYMQNNDPKTIMKGELDLMVYDQTNEKVLLMIANSKDERRPRGAFLLGQEERYRFAAVIRAAIANDNELFDFQCQGTLAEYFFDTEAGSEENYYCIMAPFKVSQKVSPVIHVPVSALRPFATCPPRYFLLGSNWGASSGNAKNPYAISHVHSELNEDAIVLQQNISEGFIQKNVMPHLITRSEGIEIMKREREQRAREQRESMSARSGTLLSSARGTRSLGQTPRDSARTPRHTTTYPSDVASASLEEAEKEDGILPEEEDPLAPELPGDVLRPVREALLNRRFLQPGYLQRRLKDQEIKKLPAVKDGRLRTPLMVFHEIMKVKHGEEEPPLSQPQSARGRLNSISGNNNNNSNNGNKGSPRTAVRNSLSVP